MAPRPTLKSIYLLVMKHTDVSRYKMPSMLKDKLTSYLCALTLHIDGFSVNPELLAKDLQLPMTRYLLSIVEL